VGLGLGDEQTVKRVFMDERQFRSQVKRFQVQRLVTDGPHRQLARKPLAWFLGQFQFASKMFQMDLPNTCVTDPKLVSRIINGLACGQAELRRCLRQPDEHARIQEEFQAIPQFANSASESGAKQPGVHRTGLEVTSPTLGRRAVRFR